MENEFITKATSLIEMQKKIKFYRSKEKEVMEELKTICENRPTNIAGFDFK